MDTMERTDFIELLRLLKIKLPDGVLSEQVIELSDNYVKDARQIVKDLETFQLQFTPRPRLACREVKRAITLQEQGNVREVTKMIFFKKNRCPVKQTQREWEQKTRFRLRQPYRQIYIPVPDINRRVQYKHQSPERILTNGKGVGLKEELQRAYVNEKTFNIRNPREEPECLKHFLESTSANVNNITKVTKGNKVEFGFITGNVDFLIERTEGRQVIECKFTRENREAYMIKQRVNFQFQVKSYMYLVGSQNQAVLVIRQYHKDRTNQQDIMLEMIEMDAEDMNNMDQLRLWCQREVLACFLAVLKLVFQKQPQ